MPSASLPLDGSSSFFDRRRSARSRQRALTLVEVMAAMSLLVLAMLGFLGAFIQSRRVTESAVMHAAATSLVYGIVEQIKGFDYTGLVPSTAVDAQQALKDAFPGSSSKNPPYLRVRLNQDQVTWLQCVYTPGGSTPQAPTTTPDASATAASLGAFDNIVGPLALSSFSTAHSQALSMHLWIWVDEMPDVTNDVSEVKRITIVYSYSYNDGNRVRTLIDREVFMRTRFDQ